MSVILNQLNRSVRKAFNLNHNTASYIPAQENISSNMIKFLNQKEAQNIDEELFNEYKFSLDQLMELAGYACAVAIENVYSGSSNKILICCGPGNNGGDGLVCARHLSFFGFKPTIFYPKRTNKPIFNDLIIQCEKMNIPFLMNLPAKSELIDQNFNLIVDALFGFSFSGEIRPPFDDIIDKLKHCKTPICSVDIPSGWEVESESNENGLKPEMLISLTAPKLCAKQFKGKYHYLAGRFIPENLQDKYKLNLPKYPNSAPCVLLEKKKDKDEMKSQ